MVNEDEEMEPVQLVQMNTYQSNTHRKYLKLVSAILYQIFIFSPNHSPSNHSFFSSRDIPILIFFPLPFHTRFKRTNGSGIINDVMHWFA